MAPKKRKAASAAPRRARGQKAIERDVLPESRPARAVSTDVCGACLLPVDFSEADVGLVDSCSHIFHHECVKRWASTENSCPQCKNRFYWMASYSPAGQRTSLQRVERRDQEGEEDDDDFEDIQCCEKCKEVGVESTLLLCDGMHGTCNAAYHYFCVGLSGVPRGSWFCPDCIERGFDVDSKGRRGKRPAVQAAAVNCSSPAGAAAAGPSRTPAAASSVSEAAAAAAAPASAAPASAAPVPVAAAVPAALAAAAASSEKEERDPSFGPGGSFLNGRSRGRGSLPAHLRLSALACVTPAVEVPSFAAGSGRSGGGAAGSGAGSSGIAAAAQEPQNLFATFAARRRARRGESEKPAATAASFIKLNPTYEEDFMGTHSA
eukprot:gnl/TRDRNA2_/TRDRNA2_92413_c0_seq1.p1 gnl/TRDRNA2_/TRDRNA2_92413_c0~~gnl/TRDRNA2_/TRDRNA2_92413_c0_seq1.p1  ORF type:complete len:386 (-),score=79.11 gnl/TRDRNA2_/TRDRNA2_92413_c0_seq1:106-1236(-)